VTTEPHKARPAHGHPAPSQASPPNPNAPAANSSAAHAAEGPAAEPSRPAGTGGDTAQLSQALAEAVAADPGLRLTVLPHAANLRLEGQGDGQGDGALALHLRVRDGIANLTVSGPASEAAVARSSDLRAALAGQGLRLGRIDRTSAASAGSPAEAAGSKGRSRAARAAEAGGEFIPTIEDLGEEGPSAAELASGLQ
jgi:hypothetical protein